MSVGQWPMRKYLYESWARPRQWYKYQPLHTIRDYYGEEVAMYFAWLGFYTKMLIIPSIVGVLTFIAGTISAQWQPLVNHLCNEENHKDWKLCRMCNDPSCPFGDLQEQCSLAKSTAVFDNYGAIVFSVFMAVWGVVFLEMWKRYEAELANRWNTGDDEFTQDIVRPSFAVNVRHTRLNPVTKKYEPHIPRRVFLKRFAASTASVFVFCCFCSRIFAARCSSARSSY